MQQQEHKKHSQIHLIVRARTGLTRKLYETARGSANGTFTTVGAVEGPYGGMHSFASYGTVLLFAGGVGITHQLPYVRQLLAGYARGLVSTRSLTLVWTVTSLETLKWISDWMNVILAMENRSEFLRIKLYVTRPDCPNMAAVVSRSGSVQLFPGRCPIEMVIDEILRDRIGAMVVGVCGPGPFSDDVRAAVRARMGVGVLDFVEEAFSY